MKKSIFSLVLLGLISAPTIADSQGVVPANEAFKVSHIVNSEKFMVNFVVADGYHLYKDSIQVSENALVRMNDLPKGEAATDEFKGDVTYLDGTFQVTGKIESIEGDRFFLNYQGCKPNLFCYPEQKHEIILP
jgi:thiol:disulfide interchange protein DsbD